MFIKSTCEGSPFTTNFEFSPILVKNIFICVRVAFCASSRIANEFFKVLPLIKANGAISIAPVSIFLCIFSPLNVFANDTFLSLKKNKVNVRYGPGFEYPIKYIYKKINLPIKQIDKKENFRRIIDLKNNSGWIHVSQLKKVNSLIPKVDKILFSRPTNFSKPLAKIEKGRVLLIQNCNDDWCKVKTGNFKGWVKIENSWGVN